MSGCNAWRCMMTFEAQPYGGLLRQELRKLQRLDLITRKLNYAEAQRLKCANREEAVKLFRGSSYAFLHLLKTYEPDEVARRLMQQGQQAAAAAMIMMMGMPLT